MLDRIKTKAHKTVSKFKFKTYTCILCGHKESKAIDYGQTKFGVCSNCHRSTKFILK